ncbi:MAG: hypothetical protein HY896_05530 [Deltaproteobacteria bacterium]|nr:hypothetical protein [Deltaproteobacteria bacterium]
MIVFSILFILFGASVYCVVVPEQFKSSTTILVIPQRVPENYVRSSVSIRIEARLATLKQQVLSRTCLVSVMDELGLFKDERKKKPLEDVVDEMRRRIDIQVLGTDAFRLSFYHENRQMAMLTTARLSSFFIDENLKIREQQAVGTSEFLESQLQERKANLEKAEESVKQYKSKFMGELPQQMEANLGMLRGLQDRYRTNFDAIRAAEDRLVLLESQAGGLERSVQSFSQDIGKPESRHVMQSDAASGPSRELTEKRARLADLSAKYTDRYPEVLRLKAEVEKLERRIRDARSSAPAADNANRNAGPAGSQLSGQGAADAKELRRLKEQISKTELEIATHKKEREQIQNYISSYQAKVEKTPKREQDMISLTRDYENLKRSYEDLLKRKLEADVSQNMERRQKGEQFQILDPANMPDQPFKPNRLLIFGIAIMSALGVGFGGTIGLEIMDPTLRGVKEFKNFFELPVLASIPVFQDAGYVRRMAMRRAAVFGGIITFTLAVSVFLLVYGQRIRTILKF